MIVIIKLCIGVIFINTFSLRKVSSILVMIVIIKLHIRVIFRNTFSLHTKQEVIMYPCNDCDYQASYWSHPQKHIQSKQEGIKYLSWSSLTMTMLVSHGGWLWTVVT